jgi:bacteriocin biosynthesis cyclodehydratase domain-containing protein
MIARGDTEALDAVLRLVEPALLPERMTESAPALVALSGSARTADTIASTLHGCGVTVVAADSVERPDVAIAVGHHVLPPELHGHWLRRDVPHLPVVLTDSATVVGPLVRPGDGPCLHCLELHHRDADPAWPAIASQLLGRRSLAESAIGASETAAVVARLVLGWVAGDDVGRASLRIDAASGARTERPRPAHPECGCGGVEQVLEHGRVTDVVR